MLSDSTERQHETAKIIFIENITPKQRQLWRQEDLPESIVSSSALWDSQKSAFSNIDIDNSRGDVHHAALHMGAYRKLVLRHVLRHYLLDNEDPLTFRPAQRV